ncbi:putative Partitioning defective 6 gamma-like protein [Naja naja]|nr:putative Partitioning defective 6 gamma-like protein [Naja naja]
MNRSFNKSQSLRYFGYGAVEVKSKIVMQPDLPFDGKMLQKEVPGKKYGPSKCKILFWDTAPFGAEFRRFSLDRFKPGKFEDFYKLLLHIHHISNMAVMVGYADIHGDLLPINNDDNFYKAVSSANPLLRIFIQKQAFILCLHKRDNILSPYGDKEGNAILHEPWGLEEEEEEEEEDLNTTGHIISEVTLAGSLKKGFSIEEMIVYHKKQFGAEFRRFSLDRFKPGKFEDFYKLLLHIHHISNMAVMVGYADIHGDLLPINNDDNFYKAVSSANPLLRIFIQKQGELKC